MLKKNEVYVTVDSPKVAKKLKKVLDMFGETIYHTPSHNNPNHNGNGGWGYGFSELGWQGVNPHYINFKRTKVTVSELKQILFREHAKKGDVVIVDNGKFGSRWVLELTGNDVASFEHSNSFDLKTVENDFCKFGNSIAGGKFIRYATEEEKALLNLVKELEVGKWYLGIGEKLIFVSAVNNKGDYCSGYGIGADGKWYDDDGSFSWLTDDLREATKEEVETALRKEAEKRYGKDWETVKIKEHADGFTESVNIGNYTAGVSFKTNSLWNKNGVIFHNGKWSEKLTAFECEFVVKGSDIKACLERVKINALDVAVVEALADITEEYYRPGEAVITKDARQLAEKLRKLL